MHQQNHERRAGARDVERVDPDRQLKRVHGMHHANRIVLAEGESGAVEMLRVKVKRWEKKRWGQRGAVSPLVIALR